MLRAEDARGLITFENLLYPPGAVQGRAVESVLICVLDYMDEAVAMLSSNSDLPARLTTPASGLFLEQVRYEGDPVKAGPPPIALLSWR